ncbi:MAG: FtsB family cell division protein [Devosia sp.]
MPTTRLKRSAIWRSLALTMALLCFQGYLGFSAIGGQFGIANRTEILIDIDQYKAKSAALQAEIDDYQHRATLMDPRRLDPDIVTERARALLNMANADDIIVMVDPVTGKPISSKFQELAADKLTSIIEEDSTL